MKDKTLPDKEIVKALEECIELRFDDTEYATVRLDTLTNALDLITRQQAEKEALIAGHTRRLLKIICIALNETEGFGKQRLGRLLDVVTQISNEHMDDEVFWTHADKRIEQMGIPFAPEDYSVTDR